MTIEENEGRKIDEEKVQKALDALEECGGYYTCNPFRVIAVCLYYNLNWDEATELALRSTK